MQADRIIAEERLKAWLAEALDASDVEAAWDAFITCMEQRGFVLREDGRGLSLVVRHAVSNRFPTVSADQIVHIAPDANNVGAAPDVAFGGATIDQVLADPPDDSDRCRVVLQGHLVRLVPEVGIDGLCAVESSWGTTAFRLSGALHMVQGERVRLDLAAERISGFDTGPWTLAFESDDLSHTDVSESVISGHALYTDDANPSLSLCMEIERPTSPSGADEMHFRAIGDRCYLARFLTDNTNVCGSEIPLKYSSQNDDTPR